MKNSTTYWPTIGDPTSISENATEPSNWSQTAIRAIWRKNLYNEEPGTPLTGQGGSSVGPIEGVSITGPSWPRNGQYCSWSTLVSGGSGDFAHSWQVDGVNAGTDAVLWWYVESTTAFFIMVTVTDNVTGSNYATEQYIEPNANGETCY